MLHMLCYMFIKHTLHVYVINKNISNYCIDYVGEKKMQSDKQFTNYFLHSRYLLRDFFSLKNWQTPVPKEDVFILMTLKKTRKHFSGNIC